MDSNLFGRCSLLLKWTEQSFFIWITTHVSLFNRRPYYSVMDNNSGHKMMQNVCLQRLFRRLFQERWSDDFCWDLWRLEQSAYHDCVSYTCHNAKKVKHNTRDLGKHLQITMFRATASAANSSKMLQNDQNDTKLPPPETKETQTLHSTPRTPEKNFAIHKLRPSLSGWFWS